MHPLAPLVDRLAPAPEGHAGRSWELAAESVAVKIRWFGLGVGVVVANLGSPYGRPWALNAILWLGFGFTAIDTLAYRRGRVFLRDFPLLISVMEALFIGLLCHYQSGPESPFRFYYLLSLICCAIRYSPRITFATCGLDALSYGLLSFADPDAMAAPLTLALTLVILAWVTWAAGAMARLLKRAGDELAALNDALRENQSQLETRIAERTAELEASQAQVLHQEKMAAFGLLAAGIAHEVGNPLTSVSAIVQMLDRRDPEPYTRDKLRLITAELSRIQTILRELIVFGRPAGEQFGRVAVHEVIDDALRIAKFYKGGSTRNIVARIEDGVPPLVGVRDQFVQVVFNLVLNAIDATGKGGTIEVRVRPLPGGLELAVADDGAGIEPGHRGRLFKPYFTTKKHGTGLGLFVIRRIVEGHGGAVAVESEVGRGTTFTVTLPTPNPAPVKRPAPEAVTEAPRRVEA